MSKEKMDAIVTKTDALVKRMDSFATKRQMRKDADRRRMADARIAAGQSKLDAYAAVDADEDAIDDSDEEDDCMPDSQMNPGLLSKRNIL